MGTWGPQGVSGKVVVITGAARGIGADAARRLARRGAKVALIGLEPEELRKTAESCGPDATAWDADVTPGSSSARRSTASSNTTAGSTS